MSITKTTRKMIFGNVILISLTARRFRRKNINELPRCLRRDGSCLDAIKKSTFIVVIACIFLISIDICAHTVSAIVSFDDVIEQSDKIYYGKVIKTSLGKCDDGMNRNFRAYTHQILNIDVLEKIKGKVENVTTLCYFLGFGPDEDSLQGFREGDFIFVFSESYKTADFGFLWRTFLIESNQVNLFAGCHEPLDNFIKIASGGAQPPIRFLSVCGENEEDKQRGCKFFNNCKKTD